MHAYVLDVRKAPANNGNCYQAPGKLNMQYICQQLQLWQSQTQGPFQLHYLLAVALSKLVNVPQRHFRHL